MAMLLGKVAIITGASAGIGLATARLFAREGATLVLNARNGGPLQRIAAEIRGTGGMASVVAGDVRSADTHQRLIASAMCEFGGLDIAINNAGMTGTPAPLAGITGVAWQEILDTNLTAAFLGARSQIPAMLERGAGSIVFTSSFVGTSAALPGMSAYGVAKAGITGLVKGITADYGAAGIRANAILSGGVDTAMAGDAAQKAWAAGLHAMKRIARPEEIAQAMLFLASDMASFVTGAALAVDGGNAAVK